MKMIKHKLHPSAREADMYVYSRTDEGTATLCGLTFRDMQEADEHGQYTHWITAADWDQGIDIPICKSCLILTLPTEDG